MPRFEAADEKLYMVGFKPELFWVAFPKRNIPFNQSYGASRLIYKKFKSTEA